MGGDVLTRRSVLQGLIATLAPAGLGPSAARRSSHDRRSNAVQSRDASTGHPFSSRQRRQRDPDARPRSRLRDAGPPRGAPPPRLSGAGVQLAEGHGADRRRRVSRPRARRARVRPHVRCGRQVHRRPPAVWQRQQDPRHARAGVRAGLSLGRRRHRARPGFAARRLVRTRATGRLPLGRHDERPVRRPACAAVQYRERSSSRRHPA